MNLPYRHKLGPGAKRSANSRAVLVRQTSTAVTHGSDYGKIEHV